MNPAVTERCAETAWTTAETVITDGDGTRTVAIGIPEWTPISPAALQALARSRPISNSVEPHHNMPQTGRNAPCPCGSGRKYKRCCREANP